MASPASPKRPFDFFVDIGGSNQGGAAHLAEPQPPEPPNRRLPARHDPGAAFVPEPRLSSHADLQQELARMRKKISPFLQMLAPKLKATRRIHHLTQFQRRRAEPEDWRNFQRATDGAGDWEAVSIPDYGEPLGRATLLYRASFAITLDESDGDALFIRFNGVDYKAHIFVNGTFVGSHEGFFAPFEFDITPHVRAGDNTLVVRVDNDSPCMPFHGQDGDKIYAATGPGYDDPALGWHHCPPGMGITQGVSLQWRPRVHLADLFVRPLPGEESAEAWVEVWNGTETNQPVEIGISVFGRNFKATPVRNRSMGTLKEAGHGLTFYRCTFPLRGARCWEPDAPWLYELQAELRAAGRVDRQSRAFGMRSFVMDDQDGVRGRMRLNGREIRLRGANTMGFEQLAVMRGDTRRLHDDILLAKIAGMNFLRVTQRPVQEEVYAACDQLGLMIQTDLPLFGCLRRNQFCEAVRQSQEMEHLIRPHPCAIMVSFINEPFPAAWPDVSHRNLTRSEMDAFFDSATIAVRLLNPDRVVKAVDGDFNPPAPGLPDQHCYTFWYNGHGIEAGKLIRGYWQKVKQDWNYYGCGEFGAEGLDRVELMRRHCPPEWLPVSTAEERDWSPSRIAEAQTGKLHRLWFDTQTSLKDWVAASREHQRWAVQLQTEAYRRDNRMNSFAIHLFIDAWPTGWMKTIMDVERHPKPAYFAYRDALRPLMAHWRTDRWAFTAGETMEFEAWLCNDTHEAPRGLRLHYQLEVDGQTVFAASASARPEKCRSACQGALRLKAPVVTRRTTAVLRIGLLDEKKRVLQSSAADLIIVPAETAAGARVYASGGSRAAALVQELGLQKYLVRSPDQADILLIDGQEHYRALRKEAARGVRRGARVVLLAFDPGTYTIGSRRVTVEAPSRGARQFVSRATGHPLVEGFHPSDFRLWHDPALDRIAPLMRFLFRGKDWRPVLLTTQPDATGAWTDALAVGELKQGAGSWILCQLELAGRTTTNPAARRFGLRLFQGKP